MSILNNCHLEFFEKMAIFGNFQEKKGNFLAIFEKKMAIFWQFLKKKWQFSGNFWTIKW